MHTIAHNIFWCILQGVFQRVHDLLIEDQVIQASQVRASMASCIDLTYSRRSRGCLLRETRLVLHIPSSSYLKRLLFMIVIVEGCVAQPGIHLSRDS